ncbi:MAG: hypothetical protein QM657_13655 [Lacrimispora sp.]|uniref:hypothetical protein n=1 Tax=Lacrimispora sp. TaxID=2719234 RepID=UPI0039E56BB5
MLNREKKYGKKKIPDSVKAGIFRWWIAGMCYFFIGFGTQAGGFADPLDLIFFLGLGLGIATLFLYNPVAYRMFDIVRNGKVYNQSYFERSGWQNARFKLAEILKNMVLVFFVYMTYQTVNLLLESLLRLPKGTVIIPGEPFGFAAIYVIYYHLLTRLGDKAEQMKRKGREKQDEQSRIYR